MESSSVALDEEAIISQLRTIISAGYETVSAIVAVSLKNRSLFPLNVTQWLLYELAMHPKIQGDLRDEICAIPNPSFDDFMNRLTLLDAVVKETLRLHPAILENHHEASTTHITPIFQLIFTRRGKQLPFLFPVVYRKLTCSNWSFLREHSSSFPLMSSKLIQKLGATMHICFGQIVGSM